MIHIDLLLTPKENNLRGVAVLPIMSKIKKASVVGVIYEDYIKIVKNRITEELFTITKAEYPEYFL